MGFLANIRDADFTGLNRAFGKGRHSSKVSSTNRGENYGEAQVMGVGIAGGPQVRSRKGFGRLGGGGGGMMDDEDTGTVQVAVRGATAFFILVNLLIYVAIAVFQKNWNVGPSGLTGLALFVNIEALLHAIVFLAVPQIYERTDKLKGFARAIRLTRVQFIVFGTHTSLMLIMSLVTTISAYTGGCKDSSTDPHADNSDYISALPGFCRDKRAAAAFWWFSFMAFGASLGLTTKAWYSIRKLGPRHPTFQPPVGAAHGAETAAFDEGEADEEEHGYDVVGNERRPFEGGDEDPFREGPGVGARPSNAGGYYGERPAFNDEEPPPSGYGAPQRQQTSVQYQPPPPQMAPAYDDPFEQIRAQIYQSGR